MKHGRHASDYDKIRRDAGLAKPKYQAPPPEFPDSAIEPPRGVEAAHDDFKERMATRVEVERQQSVEAKAKADALTMRANLSVMATEYLNARVTPPYTDEKGNPKFSLQFLFKMGWSIQMVGHENLLVSPIAAKEK